MPTSKHRPWLAGIWWALGLLALTLFLALYWTSLLSRENQGVADGHSVLIQVEELNAQVRNYQYRRLDAKFDSLLTHPILSSQDRLRVDSLRQMLGILIKTREDKAREDVHFAYRDEYFMMANRLRSGLINDIIVRRVRVQQQVSEVRLFLGLLAMLGLLLIATILVSVEVNRRARKALETELAQSLSVQEATARQLRQRELELQAMRFEAVVDHFPAAVLIYDPQLQIRFANRAALELLQVTWAQLANQQIAAPTLPQSYQELLADVRHNHQPRQAEVLFPASTQHTLVLAVPQLVNGQLDRIIAFHSGINERKTLEAALATTNERLTEVLNGMRDGFCVLDTDYRFVFVNAALAQILRVNPRDLIGRVIWDLYPFAQDHIQYRYWEAYHRAMNDRERSRFVEWFPDQQLWLDIEVQPVREGLAIFAQNVTKEKSSREALQAREQFLSSIVNNFPGGSVVVYDRNYRITFAGGQDIWRLSPDPQELIGWHLQQVFDNDEQAWLGFRPSMDRAFAGEIVKTDVTWRQRHYQVTLAPMANLSGQADQVLVLTQDQTEQVRNREAASQLEGYYRAIARNFPNGTITIYNPDMTIAYSDGQELTELGFSTEILLGHNLREYYEPGYYDSFLLPIHQRAFQGETVNFLLDYSGKSYNSIVTPLRDGEGRVKQILGVYFNITEQRRSELALRRSETQFRAIIEHFPRGAIVVYNRDLVVEFADGQVYRSQGINVQQFIGKHISDYLSGDTLIERKAQYERCLAGETVPYLMELNGTPFSCTAVPLPGVDGSIERILVVSIDVTEQLEAQRVMASSLQEKQVLLSEIHHRVKNNLAIVSGLLQLQAQNLENAEAKAVLQQSQARIHTMAMIHQSLYESDNFAIIHLSDYIRRLVLWLEGLYEQPGLQIKTELDLAPVSLDLFQAVPFSLILSELLTNSYKHAFQGRQHGTIQIRLWRANEQLNLDYRDDGVGLPSDLKTGLGINLIEGLSRQINATLTYSPGTHTRFQLSLSLPVEQATA